MFLTKPTPRANPLSDFQSANLNLKGAAEAWADLWFYSNPIFVYVD
ncbi:MAG: hypothetical protein WAM73_19720 [Desulfobacterales bacterium]